MTTSHATHDHEATSSARAACRKATKAATIADSMLPVGNDLPMADCTACGEYFSIDEAGFSYCCCAPTIAHDLTKD